MSDSQQAFLGDVSLVVDARALAGDRLRRRRRRPPAPPPGRPRPPASPVLYAGSIERVDFGEEHETKGFVVARRRSRGASTGVRRDAGAPVRDVRRRRRVATSDPSSTTRSCGARRHPDDRRRRAASRRSRGSARSRSPRSAGGRTARGNPSADSTSLSPPSRPSRSTSPATRPRGPRRPRPRDPRGGRVMRLKRVNAWPRRRPPLIDEHVPRVRRGTRTSTRSTSTASRSWTWTRVAPDDPEDAGSATAGRSSERHPRVTTDPGRESPRVARLLLEDGDLAITHVELAGDDSKRRTGRRRRDRGRGVRVKLERVALRGFLSHTDTDWSPNGARLVTLVGRTAPASRRSPPTRSATRSSTSPGRRPTSSSSSARPT
jgi:hypothetical protein